MKKVTGFVLIVFILVFILTGCSGESNALTIKNGILLVGMDIDYPPMEYLADNGITPIGFDVSLGKALAEKLNLEVQFVDIVWESIFNSVNTRKIDCIISSVTITEERLQYQNFSKPYIQNTLALVVLKNSRYNVRSPEDLTGLRVAYQYETTANEYMDNLALRGLRFTPSGYDRTMYCFDELRLGRVDAILTDLVVAHHYLTNSDNFDVVWQGDEEQFGICMRKGNDILTEAIDKALDELFRDGTMLRLSREFFNGRDLVSAVRQ